MLDARDKYCKTCHLDSVDVHVRFLVLLKAIMTESHGRTICALCMAFVRGIVHGMALSGGALGGDLSIAVGHHQSRDLHCGSSDALWGCCAPAPQVAYGATPCAPHHARHTMRHHRHQLGHVII